MSGTQRKGIETFTIIAALVLVLIAGTIVVYGAVSTTGSATGAIDDTSSEAGQQAEDLKDSVRGTIEDAIADGVDHDISGVSRNGGGQTDSGYSGGMDEMSGMTPANTDGPSILDEYDEREPTPGFQELTMALDRYCGPRSADYFGGQTQDSFMLEDEIDYVTMVGTDWVAKYSDDTVATIPVGQVDCQGVKICNEPGSRSAEIDAGCTGSGAITSGNIQTETYFGGKARRQLSGSTGSGVNLKILYSYDKLVLVPLEETFSQEGTEESSHTGLIGNNNLAKFAEKVSEGCGGSMSEKEITHTFERACKYIHIEDGMYRCAHVCPVPTSLPARFGDCDEVMIQNGANLDNEEMTVTVQYDGSTATIIPPSGKTVPDGADHDRGLCYEPHSGSPGSELEGHRVVGPSVN